jgi:hypothetical protein
MWPTDWGKALEVLAAERRQLLENPNEQNREALEELIAKFPELD